MLVKILPLDSADMRYGYIAPYDYSDRMYDGGYDKIPYPKELSDKIQLVEEYASELPCWSLDALLNKLTKPLLSKYDDGKWTVIDYTNGKVNRSLAKDTAVDACVGLISHLQDKGIL